MDKLNAIHKTLIITMAAMFIVNLSILQRIQQDLHHAMSELRIRNELTQQDIGELASVVATMHDDCTIEGDIDGVTGDGFTDIEQSIGRRELPYGKEIGESERTAGMMPNELPDVRSDHQVFHRDRSLMTRHTRRDF